MRVAFFVQGSFAHILSKQIFGEGMDGAEVSNANEVVSAIEQDRADVGIVPYYNSFATTEGIPLSYQLLGESSSVHVDFAVDHAIRLCLAGPAATELTEVETVYLMPVTHPQCREFLERFLPSANLIKQDERQDIESTRAALEKARNHGAGAAAVGPIETARQLGLTILAPRIENDGNTTSFLVLRRGEPSNPSNRQMLYLAIDASLGENQALERVTREIPNDIVLYQWAALPIRTADQTDRFVLIEADTGGKDFPHLNEQCVNFQRTLGNGHAED
jgi:prephenate dehydratase